MTTDNFTEAARTEAEALVDDIIRWDDTIATDGPCDGTWDSLAEYLAGRGWARTRLAVREATDAEVLAALNATHPTYAKSSLRLWGVLAVEQMRAALSVRAARRDEEKR